MEKKRYLVFIVTTILMLNILTLTAFSETLQGVWTAQIGSGAGSRSYKVELKGDGTCTFYFGVQNSGDFVDAYGIYTVSGENVKLSLNYDAVDESTIPYTTVPSTAEVDLTYSNDTLIFTDHELNRKINLRREATIDSTTPPNNALSAAKEAFPQHYHEFESKIVYNNGAARNYSYRDNFKALIINGSLINAEVKTINNRTLVPVRIVGEYLNFNVDWNAASKKVTLTNQNTKIEMTISSGTAKVNNKDMTLDAPPQIYNNSTYVPVRFVAEAIGAKLEYYAESDNRLIVYDVPNVIIEYMGTGAAVISKDDAINRTYSGINGAIRNYKSDLDSYFKQNSFNTVERVASYFNSVNNVNYYGEASRYYVFRFKESRTLYFDKYTGNIYYSGGFSAHSKLNKLDLNSKNGFIEFFSEHFTQ